MRFFNKLKMSLRTGAPNALNVFSNKIPPPIHYLEIFLNRLYIIP